MLNKIKANWSIIYKLSNDLLLVLLIFFVVAMVGEAVLPGIISAHVGMYEITLLILLDILGISFLGRKLQIGKEKFLNKKTTIFLIVVTTLFLLNSVLKINFYLIPVVVIISLVSIYFLYQVLNEEK